MGKEDIIDYVMKTPENTNPNILRSLLDSEANNNKYIVTLTPTSLDYSGTMDKTVAEINAAYEAGQQIVFRVYTGDGTYNEADCTIRYKNGDNTYPSFNAYLVDGNNNVLIFAYTSVTNDGTKQTYHTDIYSLTPAS